MSRKNESKVTLRVDDKTGKGIRSAKSNMQDFTAAVGTIQGPLNGVTGRMSAFNMAVGRAGIVFATTAVALAGFTRAMYESFTAGTSLEQQQLTLAAVIKSTGGAAGFSAEQIGEMSKELDRTTLASAKGARDAATALLSFKRISGPIFERTLVAAQDMSAVFKGELRTSAVQLGKALEDPAVGLTALNRVGITFTQTEKDLIVSMQDAGKMAEAQTLILEKLEGQIGGAGKAQASGTAGSVDTLVFAWAELLEEFGKTTAGEGAVAVLDGITSAITRMKAALEDEDDKSLEVQLKNQIKLLQELGEEQAKLTPGSIRLAYKVSEIEGEENRLRGLLASLEVEKEQNTVLREKAQIIQEESNKSTIREQLKESSDLANKERFEFELARIKLLDEQERQAHKNKMDRILEANRKLNDAAQEEIDKEKEITALKLKADVLRAKSERSALNNTTSFLRAAGKEYYNLAKLAIVIEKGQAISGIIAEAAKARMAAAAWATKAGPGASAAFMSSNAWINGVMTANIAAVSALGAIEINAVGGGGGSGGGGSIDFSVDDPSVPNQLPQEAPQINIIRVEMGGRILGEVVAEGNRIAIDNDMQGFVTEDTFQRVIMG